MTTEDKKPISFDRRKVIKLTETMDLYGIAPETVRKWIHRDITQDGMPPLEAFKPGKDILIYREVLEAYIRRFPVSA